MGNEDVDDIAFWEYIRDSFYYDNNMNFIANTLLVMLELTVVNQWHAITRMYIEIVSPWAYIYFYSFYFVSVLIVTNVLTAFIFDAFIIQFEINTNNRLELEKKRQRKQTIEKTRRLKKEKEIQCRANKQKDEKRKSIIPRIVTALSKSAESSDNIFLHRQSSANMLFGNLGDDATTTRDVLDEFLEDLSISDRDEWHKWLAVAMLYEYETDDVLKGLWLYDKTKTTADFYEQIYGKNSKPFDEYLADWNETAMDDNEFEENDS